MTNSLTIAEAVAYAVATTESWRSPVLSTGAAVISDVDGQPVVEVPVTTAAMTYYWAVWRTVSGEIYGEA